MVQEWVRCLPGKHEWTGQTMNSILLPLLAMQLAHCWQPRISICTKAMVCVSPTLSNSVSPPFEAIKNSPFMGVDL